MELQILVLDTIGLSLIVISGKHSTHASWRYPGRTHRAPNLVHAPWDAKDAEYCELIHTMTMMDLMM